MPSRPYIDIPFGPYLPDFGGMPNPEAPGYLVDAINVRLTLNGYRGMPTFADVAGATAIGSSLSYARAACHYTASSVFHFFVVNDSGEMYESRSEGTDTWQNVSPTGAALAPFGNFIRFGEDVIYACSTRAPVSKALSATHATDFTDLAGSPPTGAVGARVRQHVVLGQLAVGDFYSIRTSAIGDHEDWPTPGTADARAKQSIYETLNSEYGHIERIVGGEKFGIIVQTYALTRMTYVGGSSVYEFDTFDTTNGNGYGSFYLTPVSDGKRWYWYNESGVYATDGYSVARISDGKIDAALFINQLSHPNGSSLPQCFTAAYDARRRLILFGGNEYTGATTYQLAYQIDTDSFSLMQETNRTAFFEGYRNSTTINVTGRNVYNINGSSRKLQRLGTNGTPTIAMQTGYIEIDPGYRVQLQGAHILGAGTGSLTLAYKTAASSSACDMAQSGFTSLTAAGLGEKKTGRASSQYIAFRITGTGAESQLIRGIRVYFERAEAAP